MRQTRLMFKDNSMRESSDSQDSDGSDVDIEHDRRTSNSSSGAERRITSSVPVAKRNSRRCTFSPDNEDYGLHTAHYSSSEDLSNKKLEAKTDRPNHIYSFPLDHKYSDQDSVNWSSDDELRVTLNNTKSEANTDTHLKNLAPNNKEFVKIQSEFSKVSLIVTSVEKVINEILLDRYIHERDHVRQARQTGFDLNEQYLYHGTTASKRSVCEEGLDQRLSRRGRFGRGIYFSDNPRKSLHYSHSSDSEKPWLILQCKVILGDTKVYEDGQSDPDLVREPVKAIPTNGWKYYDSVMGRPKDSREFVIYDGRRAITEYVIQVERNSTKYLTKIKPKRDDEKLKWKRFHQDTAYSEPNIGVAAIKDTDEKLKWKRFPLDTAYAEANIGVAAIKVTDEKLKWKRCEVKSTVLDGVSTEMAATDTCSGTKLKWKSCEVDKTFYDEVCGRKRTVTASQQLAKLTVEFSNVTSVRDFDKAEQFVTEANMNLDQAIVNYYRSLE